MLGPAIRASRAGVALELGPVRQQAVLAMLVLRADSVVSQRELIEGIWGFDPPTWNPIPGYIFRLRQILHSEGSPKVIVSDGSGYRFAGAGVSIDVAELAGFAAEASSAWRSGDRAAAIDKCSQALALFNGEPLANLSGDFAAGERQRLVEYEMTLLLQKFDWQTRTGRHEDAIGPLSALNRKRARNEPVAALLMRALYAGGRRSDALDVYAAIRARLAEDLGMDPGEDLRRTHEAILRGDARSLGLTAE